MKKNEAVTRGSPVHLKASVRWTVCRVRIEVDEPWFITDDEVDCMACIALGSTPSLEDSIACAFQLPREFLFGDE